MRGVQGCFLRCSQHTPPSALLLYVRKALLRQVSHALQSIERIAEKRKVRHRVEVINQDPPATCSQKVLHTACSPKPVFCQYMSPYKEASDQARHNKVCLASQHWVKACVELLSSMAMYTR